MKLISENSSAFIIIGGGDSIALAQKSSVIEKINHPSTGGGATLAYLGNETLPGLQPFQ